MKTPSPAGMLHFVALVLVSLAILSPTNATSATSAPWRYRITVSVTTPEGVKQGSVVRQIGADAAQGASGGGEAVVVDLGKRGYLFGLLQGVTGSLYNASAIPAKLFPKRAETSVGTLAYLSPEQYPKFVYFTNLTDPKTVRNVLDATHICCEIAADHTEEIFGAGVHIESIALQITNDPVTSGIDKLLPWLVTIGGHNLGGTDGCFPQKQLYTCLDVSDFKRTRL